MKISKIARDGGALKHAAGLLERGDAIVDETRPDIVKHERVNDVDDLSWTTSLDEDSIVRSYSCAIQYINNFMRVGITYDMSNKRFRCQQNGGTYLWTLNHVLKYRILISCISLEINCYIMRS